MNQETKRKRTIPDKSTEYDSFRRRNSIPKVELSNSTPLNLIELKAQKIIEEGSFMIPRVLIDPNLGFKKKKDEAVQFIKENWPVNEAAKLLDDIKQVDIIGVQLHSAQFKRLGDIFSVPVYNVGGQDLFPYFKPFRNIFFDKNFGEADLKFVESTEWTHQANYEKISMENMYRMEVERVLKSQNKMNERASLKDWKNTMAIITIRDENLVLVISGVGERGTGRIGEPKTILFETKNPEKLVNFLSANRTIGMNALFSLLASSELTPSIPFDRSETYYGSQDKPQGPLFVTTTKLVEVDIYSRTKKTSLGKVKRLQPL